MRPLMVMLFATAISIAMATISTNQTQNVSNIPSDFLQGVNSVLNITIAPAALDSCEETYLTAVISTGIFAKYLFKSWGVDFALMEGILGGPTFEDSLEDWKDACEPVAYEYENYFEKAIYAYQENKEAFFATVESNFNSNEVGIIELGIALATQLEARDYSYAGFEFGQILEVLLSQWLPTN